MQTIRSLYYGLRLRLAFYRLGTRRGFRGRLRLEFVRASMALVDAYRQKAGKAD